MPSTLLQSNFAADFPVLISPFREILFSESLKLWEMYWTRAQVHPLYNTSLLYYLFSVTQLLPFVSSRFCWNRAASPAQGCASNALILQLTHSWFSSSSVTPSEYETSHLSSVNLSYSLIFPSTSTCLSNSTLQFLSATAN